MSNIKLSIVFFLLTLFMYSCATKLPVSGLTLGTYHLVTGYDHESIELGEDNKFCYRLRGCYELISENGLYREEENVVYLSTFNQLEDFIPQVTYKSTSNNRDSVVLYLHEENEAVPFCTVSEGSQLQEVHFNSNLNGFVTIPKKGTTDSLTISYTGVHDFVISRAPLQLDTIHLNLPFVSDKSFFKEKRFEIKGRYLIDPEEHQFKYKPSR